MPVIRNYYEHIQPLLEEWAKHFTNTRNWKMTGAQTEKYNAQVKKLKERLEERGITDVEFPTSTELKNFCLMADLHDDFNPSKIMRWVPKDETYKHLLFVEQLILLLLSNPDLTAQAIKAMTIRKQCRFLAAHVNGKYYGPSETSLRTLLLKHRSVFEKKMSTIQAGEVRMVVAKGLIKQAEGSLAAFSTTVDVATSNSNGNRNIGHEITVAHASYSESNRAHTAALVNLLRDDREGFVESSTPEGKLAATEGPDRSVRLVPASTDVIGESAAKKRKLA